MHADLELPGRWIGYDDIEASMLSSSLSSSAPHRRPARSRAARRTAFQRGERVRLRAHFREVMAELRARDVSELSDAQRQARARLIAELERYAAAGRFPHNHCVPGHRVPVFVDGHGTRCAVAHLIESTGHAALVARVAASRNLGWIHEIAADAELRRWLDECGISAAEAGRIQPSYCFSTKAEACFCNGQDDAVGVIEATYLAEGAEYTFTARVDAVHGGVNAKVGDEIVVTEYGELDSDSMLIVVGWGDESYDSPSAVRADGTVDPGCYYKVPPLRKEDAIDAVLSGDCVAHLGELHRKWSQSICRSNGCDCAQDDNPDPFSVALLATLVGWRTMRRRRDRKRRNGVEGKPGPG
ncbi:hypothetical protein OV090_07540 [Nannocystis sp. RBIL2]|uniref:hypothetical protein n=1 Tax=Nannocystis sp. RBIL2 TaxID=2996788 RepID=UPI0022717CAF|nr:hypothetical protein [Nannocystis sp. RBIL2]MCY1064608.1 hypothetical protein [Nannocystis sp. RBIL2]